MLAWSEGTDNGRQKTKNHGYDVIVGGELLQLLDHPRKLVTLNPKTQINRRRTLPASFPFAVALQQIKERGALPMIDRGDIRPGNRPLSAISGLHCRALVMAVRA